MSNEIKINLTLTFSDIYDLIHAYYFADEKTRKALRETIKERHPKAYANLENTSSLLIKEMQRYDNLAIQKICKECDHKILARAMLQTEEFQKYIFPNVSKRTSVVLREDMESMASLVESDNLYYIKEAQVSVLELIRNLYKDGEIIPESEILK